VSWIVEVGDEFEPEFNDLHETLNDSRCPDTREQRFSAVGGEWGVAFAFDPRRKVSLHDAACP
jgi:hypothetical protein